SDHLFPPAETFTERNLMPAVVSDIVEVCVFRREADGPGYLLLRRSEDETLYPGIWQLVSGTLENGEQAVNGAVREFQEETGLRAVNFWVVPFVNSFYVASDDAVHLTCFFAVEVSPGEEPKLSGEHDAYQWCRLEKADAMLVWPGQKRGLRHVHELIVGGGDVARLTSVIPP
ncbi:MAG: NUDIX domain-containing protein, partial [Bacteroidota bacterium]